MWMARTMFVMGPATAIRAPAISPAMPAMRMMLSQADSPNVMEAKYPIKSRTEKKPHIT
ncbi:hypothetical protein Mpet_1362 [Methanolacinia petrolearia DSM 11571]|uniref:Uncharacterized protein n=2 Tax=Methanolacinia TaxID=230355 RepID=E1REV1_METP4|nr:hypothetical protein Mpet_1362 [Methanolacinia petrolearia DSM 11571]